MTDVDRSAKTLEIPMGAVRDRDVETLALVSDALALSTGKGFFRTLVAQLERLLDPDLVLVGEVVRGELPHVETLAVRREKAAGENFTYLLAGTPCEDVCAEGLCIHDHDVSQMFSGDEVLVKMGINGYAGMALRSATGQVIGLIALLFRRELRGERDRVGAILQLFGARAGAELDRLHSDRALRALFSSTSAFTGASFFEAAAKSLCDWLGCEIAFVAEMVDGGRTARILAMLRDGVLVEPQSYSMEGTPCKELLATGYRHYDDHVAELFPDDLYLTQESIRSYVGVPVHKVGGEPLGIICALSRSPMVPPERTFDVFSILASRVGAEIEHLRMRRGAEELQERVRRSEKLEAVGSLAAGIAHDFNNLLSVIVGFTEIVRAKLPPGTEDHQNLGSVLSASQRALGLVRQILACGGKSLYGYAPVAVGELVLRQSAQFGRLMPDTIAFQSRVKVGSDAWVRGDETQLRQVLENLCLNARQALPSGGGRIEVGLEAVSRPPDALLAEVRPATDGLGFVRLSVRDDGPGIEESIRNRIFDPFFTTAPQGERSGMGLAVVQGIVEAHGGAVEVHSAPGQGTCFHVYLPCSPLPAKKAPSLRRVES